MVRRNSIIIISVFLFIITLFVGYYFYPRKVKFELVQKIQIKQRDHSLIILREKDVFERFTKENLNSRELNEDLTNFLKLDFVKNDYLLTFNKELKSLKHSPYLSRKYDLCSYLDAKPVIPCYGDTTDKCLYIYKIKVKNKYRSICP